MVYKPTILIADDDQGLLTAVTIRLEKAGYEVTQATNGRVALDMAKAQPPELLILDVNMPGCDGFSLVEMMDKIPGLQTIPVIYITGAVDEHELDAAGGRLGAIATIRKPFEIGELMQNIELVLPPIERAA